MSSPLYISFVPGINQTYPAGVVEKYNNLGAREIAENEKCQVGRLVSAGTLPLLIKLAVPQTLLKAHDFTYIQLMNKPNTLLKL